MSVAQDVGFTDLTQALGLSSGLRGHRSLSSPLRPHLGESIFTIGHQCEIQTKWLITMVWDKLGPRPEGPAHQDFGLDCRPWLSWQGHGQQKAVFREEIGLKSARLVSEPMLPLWGHETTWWGSALAFLRIGELWKNLEHNQMGI